MDFMKIIRTKREGDNLKARKHVLEVEDTLRCSSFDGYYTGKSYIYQGCRYAIVDTDITKAKIYSSELRAKKANEMRFENYTFVVVPLDD